MSSRGPFLREGADARERGDLRRRALGSHLLPLLPDGLVADDGTAAFVALLDVLAAEKRPLSEIVAPLRRYSSASGEINRRVGDKEDRDRHDRAGARRRPGGLEARRSAGSLRRLVVQPAPSNTEPVLRLNLEADSEARMVEERDRLLARIEQGARASA